VLKLRRVLLKLITMKGWVPSRPPGKGALAFTLVGVDVLPALFEAVSPHRFDVLLTHRGQALTDPFHPLFVADIGFVRSERSPDIIRMERVKAQSPSPDREIAMPDWQMLLEGSDKIVEHFNREVVFEE
jgi:hypothetical protein